MELIKEISEIQKSALEYLAGIAGIDLSEDWDRGLLVKELADGGMGSFQVFQNQVEPSGVRTFGKRVSEYQYNDRDGIPVLVSLNLDSEGRLFEVDVWKIHYSSVRDFKVPE